MAALSSSCCCLQSSSPRETQFTVVVTRALDGGSHRHGHVQPRQKLAILAGAADTSPTQQQKSYSTAILAPLAACLVFTACSAPCEAGLLSGSPGMGSFEFPSLPKPEFLKKIQEENKMKYEGLDTKFKSSSYVQELLKRSKESIKKHKQEIQDKYCQRGADWGVGDCSMAAMSEEQRTSFKEVLKAEEAPQ